MSEWACYASRLRNLSRPIRLSIFVTAEAGQAIVSGLAQINKGADT